MDMTVNNNPGDQDRPVVVESSSGWIVALIIVLLVLGGLVYLWTQYRGAPTATQNQQPGANINVTLPTGGSGTSSPAY